MALDSWLLVSKGCFLGIEYELRSVNGDNHGHADRKPFGNPLSYYKCKYLGDV